MFAFRTDEQKRLVCMAISGILSVEEADRLTAELVANASTARRRFGSFRFLVDARESLVQPTATMSRFKSPDEVLEGPDDRYAIVLGSMLSKMQTDRLTSDDRMKSFLSVDSAEAWLSAQAATRGTTTQ